MRAGLVARIPDPDGGLARKFRITDEGARVLGDGVPASLLDRIWQLSHGNVLFVRELVLGAIDAGHLVEQHGVWRLVGSLVTTPRRSSARPNA